MPRIIMSLITLFIFMELIAFGGFDVRAEGTIQPDKTEQESTGSVSREVMPVEKANLLRGLQSPLMRNGVSWDIDLLGGYGFALKGELKFPDALMGRVRLGGIIINDPHMLSFGVTGSIGGLAGSWGVGAEVDYHHIPSGINGRVGTSYVDGSSGIIHMGIAWALTGVEWQYKVSSKASSHALFLTLRVPFGSAYYLAKH